MANLKLTEEYINASRTKKGGLTRKTLEGWGVPWPPPHGWKEALLAGAPIPSGEPGTRNDIKIDHKSLLDKVVMAVINAGHGHLLADIPEINIYYGCNIPTVADIVGGQPETAVITGGIEWDDRVYSFSVARSIKR